MVWNTRKRKYSEHDGHTVKKTKATKIATVKPSHPARHINETSGPTPRLSLLGLPGEIPNRILEFALTATRRRLSPYREDHLGRPQIVAKIWYRQLCDEVKKKDSTNLQPFNQLKYVCRQLHSETADMELRYNNVYVECPEKLEALLSRCTAKQYAWLQLSPAHLQTPRSATHPDTPDAPPQKVYAMHYEELEDMMSFLEERWTNPINWDYLVYIAEFCLRHPQIRVHITFSDFEYPICSPDNPDPLEYFLTTAMFISIIFRRVDLTHLLPRTIASRSIFGHMTVRDVIMDNGTNFGKTWPVPPEAVKEFEAENMRFYPTCEGGRGGVEGVIGKIAAEWVESHAREGEDAKDLRAVRATEVRRWFEGGI